MFSHNFATRLVVSLFLSLCGLRLAAQSYNVITFSVPDPPTKYTHGLGISDLGVVVGYYEIPHGTGVPYYRGFIRQADGTLQYPIIDPNDIGGNNTEPWAVNASVTVAGAYLTPDGRGHGFLLSGGNFTTVDEIAGGETVILTLNDSGDYGGAFGPSWPPANGFISIAGVVTQINVPGASATSVTGLATDGSSVGTAEMSQGFVGFLRGPSGSLHVFQVPKAVYGTYATAINSETRLVVGYYYDSAGLARGFVYHYPHPLNATGPDSPPSAGIVIEHPDVITIDGSSGTGFTYPFGVNSSGVISGTWRGDRHRSHVYGFIATPAQ